MLSHFYIPVQSLDKSNNNKTTTLSIKIKSKSQRVQLTIIELTPIQKVVDDHGDCEKSKLLWEYNIRLTITLVPIEQ